MKSPNKKANTGSIKRLKYHDHGPVHMLIESGAQVGDIHKYSAASIESVIIEEGSKNHGFNE